MNVRFFRMVAPAAFALSLLALLPCGCASSGPTPAQRDAEARYHYNQAMRLYRVPTADASNEVDRVVLLDAAAKEYARLAHVYRDVPRFASASWRSLGMIQLARGELREALTALEQVGRLYPDQHWEVIQAWKAAADALWNARHRAEAALYYRQIVSVYGKPGQPPMFDTLVVIARARLAEEATP